jgi:hypothetical protein
MGNIMNKKEFHSKIKSQQFFEDDICNPSDGEWWHSGNGETYCQVGDELAEKGFSYQEALDILGRCHGATRDEYGA